MTLESAVSTLSTKINELYLKLCSVDDKVVIIDDKLDALDTKIDILADRVALLEDAARMSISFGTISTAPFYIGNSLNSGFVPDFTLFGNLTGTYPGKAALLSRVSVEQDLIRGVYSQYMERLNDFYDAFCNQLPSIEPVIPFYAPDSASAWNVETSGRWIPELLVPVIGANLFYEDFLAKCYEWLTRFGYRDELDVEMVIPSLFDVGTGDLIKVRDGSNDLIPANLSRLVPKRAGIVNNTGVARASVPVTAAWIGYVESLAGYIEGLP